MTRRQALVLGATAVGVVACGHTAHGPDSAGPRTVASFDQGWRFHRGDVVGAAAPGYDDGAWRRLDLPHDWSIEDLPDASTDGAKTADPSGFAFTDAMAQRSAPSVIGPFDARASPVGKQTGFTVGGIGWYRKRFTVAARGSSRVELRFDGAYQVIDVWLNGAHVGSHPNGYVAYTFDLTPHLRHTGPNLIAVRVTNLGANSRWYAGSGITRHTCLTVTGPVRIPLWGVRVSTPAVGRRRSVVRVEVPVGNLSSRRVVASVRVSIRDGQGRTVASTVSAAQPIAPGAIATYDVSPAVAPARLWSPDSPHLYGAHVEVVSQHAVLDALSSTFGIRSIQMTAKGFVLNGTSLKLRGGAIHHDHGALGGVSLYRAEERRVQTLKGLGYNAIRTAHNPPSEALLDACDRLGMLVYDEFSDVWQGPKPNALGANAADYSRYFTTWWRRDLTNMILRDRNRACVMLWSLGNEMFVSDKLAGDPRGLRSAPYCRHMAALVRRLDPTRPVTEGGDWDRSGRSQVLDVGDVHYAIAPDSSGSFDAVHAAYPGRAVIQSESYPAGMYGAWQQVLRHDWAVGDFTWSARDYIGEGSIGAPDYAPIGGGAAEATAYGSRATFAGLGYPWYLSNCGDVDLIGQPKPQSYRRSVLWGLSPIEMAVERPAPAGTRQDAELATTLTWGYYDELRSWTWSVPRGHPMTVRVYTAADTVKLLLNGVLVAVKGLGEADRQEAVFTVPYAPGTLTAIALRHGAEIARASLRTVGRADGLRLTSDVAALSTGRDDLAHVLVEVVDVQGRVVPDAVVPVHFALRGAASLAGVANANPHNVDSFRRPRRLTYHGQALAILRPAKHPGSAALAATSPGLHPATLRIPVHRGS